MAKKVNKPIKKAVKKKALAKAPAKKVAKPVSKEKKSGPSPKPTQEIVSQAKKINVPAMPKIYKPKPKKGVPTVGIYSFTACSGCQLELVHSEDLLLDIAGKIDIVSFHMVRETNNPDSKVDVAIIEGSITTKAQEKEVCRIRENAGVVIAIGACACEGGLQSIRNFIDKEAAVRYVYGKNPPTSSLDSFGIDKYIKVDYYVRGCPINKHELIDLLKKLLAGQKPKTYSHPVCNECRLKENPCLLQKGELCMGPITVGGCDAICTSFGSPCESCRGPLKDASTQAIIKVFEEKGMNKEELVRLFIKFAGNRFDIK